LGQMRLELLLSSTDATASWQKRAGIRILRNLAETKCGILRS